MLALLFISTLTLTFNTTPVRAGIRVFDDFNDNSINSDLWSEGQVGGPAVNEINQRLEIFFPWNSAGEYFGAGYSSKCLLRGDFDIQVDFSLLDWPSVEQLGTGNGVRIGLAVGEGESWWSVQREGYGSLTFDFPGYPREVYACDFAGSVEGIAPTGDMSGKLRLVRSGNTLTGYYFNSGSWVNVASGWVTTEDVSFSPTAWSHDDVFMDNNVLLAFDNFIVNSGRLIAWPPEEEWHPMSPEEAQPQMRMVAIYGGDYYLEPGESFCLFYGWTFIPTNVAYDLTTGQPETVSFPNLQDKTDAANALGTVTMNEQSLEPTYSFTGTCKWYRYENPAGSGHWVVFPRATIHVHYIVFPDGLPLGVYIIWTHLQPVNPQIYPEPFSLTTVLHVEQ